MSTLPPEPTPPDSSREPTLSERIRRRFAPLGGVDLDDTLAEIRKQFADMPPEELKAAINEAIAAARDKPTGHNIYGEKERRQQIAQARSLREQARAGGLRFDAYLPPALADWLLDLIERGVFIDPSEAVFVMLGEQQELEPHADLREELLRRSCQAAMDDPHPPIPHEEVVELMKKWEAAPRPDPAVWRRGS